MLDGMDRNHLATDRDMLARLVGHFSFLTSGSLERIASGGSSGFVTAELARALLDARGHLRHSD